MTYRQHYAMVLPVPGMPDETGESMTPQRLADALRRLAVDVERGGVALRDLIGVTGPVASWREDRWVLRSMKEAGVFMSEDGHILRAGPKGVGFADTRNSGHASGMLADPANASLMRMWMWSRPEDVSSPAIVGIAEIVADGAVSEHNFDARIMLEVASDGCLRDLAGSGWTGTDMFDLLARCREAHEPVARMIMEDMEHVSDLSVTISLRGTDIGLARHLLERSRPGVIPPNGPEI